MHIQIDTRETSKRIKNATNYYEKNKHTVETKKLTYGDYIFEDQVCFEYKTMKDFIASILNHKVFNQAINQTQHYPYHFVIVDGDIKKRTEAISELYYKGHVKFNLGQYYGAIARLNTYTTVLHSLGGKQEAFKLMEKQAIKCLDDTSLVKKFSKKKEDSPAFNFLVYCVHEVNSNRAEKICDELGLKTHEDLMNVTYDDLVGINGIGDKIATVILKDLH